MESEQFAEMVHQHADSVRAFVYRRAGGLDAAISQPEDIAAEVWSVAWQRRALAPSIEIEGAVRAWLYQIARFVIANHIRKTVTRRAQDRLLRPSEIMAASAESIVVADDQLQQALSQLTPAEREVFALSVWEGLNPKQIAVVTHSSANAVSIRLFRAKRKLQTALG